MAEDRSAASLRWRLRYVWWGVTGGLPHPTRCCPEAEVNW